MSTLEQLISQSKFKNEKHKAILSILYASNLINNYLEEFFKKHELTIQQYNALRILRGQYPNPCTINSIRERMLDKMSDTSRIVERLRKAALVDRVASKKDKRAVDVVITKKGLQILSRIDEVDAEMNKPTDKLSEEEGKQLSELLQKIFDSLLE